MKVILLVFLKNYGVSGQIITVKNGYARNFLIPNKKAILATQKNIQIYEKNKNILQIKKDKKKKFFKKLLEQIQSLGEIIILKKSSSRKKIFGSIGSKDISNKIIDLGVNIEKNHIKLPNGPLKYIGSHIVYFSPSKDIKYEIKILIKSIEKNK